MWDEVREDLPHFGDVMEALGSQPEGLRAGLAVALAAQMSPKRSHHPCELSDRGRLFGGNRVLARKDAQRLPLVFICGACSALGERAGVRVGLEGVGA